LVAVAVGAWSREWRGTLSLQHLSDTWERLVKKGRHRRFEEARTLKLGQQGEVTVRDADGAAEQCPECGADAGKGHASWCLAESEELDEEA
jgi:hypothetical protein